MSGTRVKPSVNSITAQRHLVIRVPYGVVIAEDIQFIAPHMAHDARVIITRPEAVAPGLRLNPEAWAAWEERKE